MEFRDKDFSGKDVVLDDGIFTGCTFRNCRLIYRANGPVTLGANHFKENVKWVLDGAAADTVNFMTALYHGAGKGGRDLIENTFNNIRSGKL